MPNHKVILLLPLALLASVAGCARDEAEPEPVERVAAAEPSAERTRGRTVSFVGADAPPLDADGLERGRMDPAWKRVVQLDTLPGEDGSPSPERWEEISMQAVNERPMHLPLSGDVSGPSVLRAQILLDRADFSPGVLDGRWGKNTEKAVYWLQEREGLPATGRVDSATFRRLRQLADAPGELVTAHRLSAEDVEGPFVEIPDSIYEKAEMECMCYTSLTEKLSEKFHVTPELLQKLNPGVELDALTAGSTVRAPAVRTDGGGAEGKVARIVISGEGFYLHALDENGRILYHFPSTLGAEYSPSPTGEFRVTSITEDPQWHFQPELLHDVPDHRPDAIIPAGPNNAVGVVWMDLSKPHYGIHGTAEPQTIGYTTSNGCVRLTNWDALFLSRQIDPGVPVEFRDVPGRG